MQRSDYHRHVAVAAAVVVAVVVVVVDGAGAGCCPTGQTSYLQTVLPYRSLAQWRVAVDGVRSFGRRTWIHRYGPIVS